MKVLVIGSGGREHALVRGLLLSKHRPGVFVAPGNGGTDLPINGRNATNVDIAATDIDGLLRYAHDQKIDLTVVGPEDPLAAGIVDRFRKDKKRIFGPTQAAARLEWDKAHSKRVMLASGVPTADARIFEPTDAERRSRAQRPDPGDARVFRMFEKAREFFISRERPMFVKPLHSNDPRDVVDCRNSAEAIRAAERLMVEQILGPNGAIIAVDEHATRGFDLAREYILTRDDEPLVVKAAGLAKGKGVFMCADPDEALAVAQRLMLDRTLGDAGESIVVEERITGREVSVLALVDGRTIYVLEVAQDHKRLLDGDAGPNTGGMGAFSAHGLLSDGILDQIQKQVFVPMIDAMIREEAPYTGVLYAGLMLTHGGPKTLEFNCRFGDPETQPMLMRLRTDLLDVLNATVDGTLDHITLDWDPRPAVCVVMASGGYPETAKSGFQIHGLDAAKGPDEFVFHAGTKRTNEVIASSGGRVLGVTSLGDTLADARDRAYHLAGEIHFENCIYRRDIAASGIPAEMPTP